MYDPTLAHEYVRNGYDMSFEEVQSLSQRLLEQRPPGVDGRHFCYEIDGTDEFADMGRFVERVCFEAAFHNTAEEMHREYGPYEEASAFFITVDAEQQVPTGALRVIRYSEAGLKTVNDVSGPPLNLSTDAIQEYHAMQNFDDVWDVGTVAAMPGYLPGQASIQLYRGAYLAAMRENIQHIVSVIDRPALRQLTRHVGYPFVSLAGTSTFEYLGSKESQAVYGYVPEFYEKILSQQKQISHGRLGERIISRLLVGAEDYTYIGK